MNARKTQGRIFWGLLLIIMGVLFLFDRMGRLDFGDLVGRYWPVIFILIGISILLSNNFKNAGSGVFFILFGTFFLLLRLRIFERTVWHYLWPLAIIGVGLWILLRPVWHPDRKAIGAMTADELNISQIFSGSVRRIESQSFKGGKADVVFGSAEIDLRAAGLAGGRATLVRRVALPLEPALERRRGRDGHHGIVRRLRAPGQLVADLRPVDDGRAFQRVSRPRHPLIDGGGQGDDDGEEPEQAFLHGRA